MDIIRVFDRMVVVLKLGQLCRNRLLDVRYALVQPGDNPLQRRQRILDICVVISLAVFPLGDDTGIFFTYFPMSGYRIDRRDRGIVSPEVRGVNSSLAVVTVRT